MSAYLVHVKSAEKLRNADGFFGKSDPYVRLHLNGTSDKFTTKIIANDLNPKWDECFLIVPGNTGAVPSLACTVWDSDKGIVVDGSDDFLGGHEFNLAEQVGETNGWREMRAVLNGHKAKGFLNLAVKRYCALSITLDSARKLRNADGMFGKSDPFARLVGLVEEAGGSKAQWGTTKVVKNQLNPVWGESFTIDVLHRMSRGGRLRRLQIAVKDYDGPGTFSSAKEDDLGTANVPWRELFSAEPRRTTLGLKFKGSEKGSVDVAIAPAAPPGAASTKPQAAGERLSAAEERVRELEAAVRIKELEERLSRSVSPVSQRQSAEDPQQARIRALEAQLAAASMGSSPPQQLYPAVAPQPTYAPAPVPQPYYPPAPPAPALLSVRVPAGYGPGMQIIVRTPAGQQVPVQIPQGVFQGMEFRVQVS